tara:strand:- start:723 stop:1694 length:972 start_codon:yes stop_codon:yes gene_type:complete
LRLPELAPLSAHHFPTLGEGATPLIPAEGLAVELDIPHLLIKDEAQNPSQSWESRGVAMAIARARELGIGKVFIRSAGDSALAAACYASLNGLDLKVAVPEESDPWLLDQLREQGAEISTLPWAALEQPDDSLSSTGPDGWLDITELSEPARLEGAKTIGFELIYDLQRVPDVMLIPTASGVGLIAIAKAFDEMEAAGWIGSTRPQLIAIQSSQFCPLVEAFRKNRSELAPWTRKSRTEIRELRPASPQLASLALTALRDSRGAAIAIEDRDSKEGRALLARRLGLGASLSTGACVAAARSLRQRGTIARDHLVVLISPSSGP